MTITKASSLIIVMFLVGSLLLFFAANSSVEEVAEESSIEQEPKEDYYPQSSESFVANPFCFACHYDFEQEELTLDHELAGIGCERCHGESERHRSDEANITPPEIMYPKARINPTCMMCHPRHEIQHVEDHQPLLAGAETIFDVDTEDSGQGSDDAHKYCTDCHGTDHRMKVRTVRWNKATGEVIKD
jgi:cytochrome c553